MTHPIAFAAALHESVGWSSSRSFSRHELEPA